MERCRCIYHAYRMSYVVCNKRIWFNEAHANENPWTVCVWCQIGWIIFITKLWTMRARTITNINIMQWYVDKANCKQSHMQNSFFLFCLCFHSKKFTLLFGRIWIWTLFSYQLKHVLHKNKRKNKTDYHQNI